MALHVLLYAGLRRLRTEPFYSTATQGYCWDEARLLCALHESCLPKRVTAHMESIGGTEGISATRTSNRVSVSIYHDDVVAQLDSVAVFDEIVL